MAHEILIEAESLPQKGGWIVDQQSMEVIGSSYLMAHGMGVPVEDARGIFAVPAEGTYRVYALTRDWTAVFGMKEPAGRFVLKIDGNALLSELGTEGEAWHWQKAGELFLTEGKHELCLHDLTGFNGRCDAVYLTDGGVLPPDDGAGIEELRQRLNWHAIRDTEREWDLIVVGGGVAGLCLAISAIRSGVDTLLIHDRGVFGGCNSSEIRVCMGGMIHLPPYPKLGNVVQEIAPVMGDPRLFAARYYEDDRKRSVFELWAPAEHEEVLEESVTGADIKNGHIRSVVTTNTITGKKTRYRARLFADCSGDGILARLAGCETMFGRDAAAEFGESLAPEKAEKLVMGQSIRWYSEERENARPFPELDWNMHFTDANCLNCDSGDWEQETGFTRDMIRETEYIRDYGLRAIFANWTFQKYRFSEKERFANRELVWMSALGGKRESIRVKGDYILTQRDLEEKPAHDDATACVTWSIDMHFPEPHNRAEFGEAFRSYAYHRGIVTPYPVPYRCLYAKDCDNLFLGGRIVSTSHVAFSAVRVMRTLGELGEAAGIAAGVCKAYGCLPREVYTAHLDAYREKLAEGITVPAAFDCGCGDEEAYHFKDLGWLRFHPYRCDSPDKLDRFRDGIAALGLQHKYPLPDELK